MKTPTITLRDVKHCDGELQIDKHYRATIKIEHDDFGETPWEAGDGNGIVAEWTRRDKHPGELVLCEDRGSKRYFDFAGTVKLARRDGWDAEPYGTGTVGERAHRAAMADFERMHAWCNNEWHWIGVAVTVSHKGAEISADSLWGIESDGDYWQDVAREMIEGAIAAHKSEVKERKFWNARDVVTVALCAS